MKRLVLVSVLAAACGGGGSGADGGLDATSDAPPDAAADIGPILDACTAIEGGAACNPAHVKCGPTLSCAAGSQFCCIANEAGTFACDPVDAGMMMMMMQCQGMMMSEGTTMYCDEAANCPNSELCCGFVGTGGGFATSCHPSCGGNAVQFCHGNAECGSSGPCIGQMCNGVFVETCGGLIECP